MMVRILFYCFAALAITAATAVITSRHPVRAVLSLVVAFIATAGIWLTLQAEFLALILIVVYVGAVMVLFLFVVMMLDIQVEARRAGFVKFWILPTLCGIALILLLASVLGPHLQGTQMAANLPDPHSSLSALGMALFSDYIYPFELAAVVLLAAMIAAIGLTHRPRARTVRTQNPSEQVKVQPHDRLRIVKMPTSKKEGIA